MTFFRIAALFLALIGAVGWTKRTRPVLAKRYGEGSGERMALKPIVGGGFGCAGQ